MNPDFQKKLGKHARMVGDRSHGWFRIWFRKVWNVRGGGLYACGFALTFLILEARSLLEDVANLSMLFNGQAIAFLVDIAVDSFRNTGYAFAWPGLVAAYSPPASAIVLVLMFILFPKFLKKPIERWLFHDDPDSRSESDSGS